MPCLRCLLKLLIDWFLSTQIGLAMRATGDNPDMIRSFGVNTDNMTVLGLAFSNGLVALAGAMIAQYQGYADVSMGLGMIVTGLASVIFGNALIRPSTVFRGTLGAIARFRPVSAGHLFRAARGFRPHGSAHRHRGHRHPGVGGAGNQRAASRPRKVPTRRRAGRAGAGAAQRGMRLRLARLGKEGM